MPTFVLIISILVIAVFLSAQIIAVLAGQQSQRQQLRDLNDDVNKLNDRLKSPSEREAEAAQRRAIEDRNRRIRETYEYGGC